MSETIAWALLTGMITGGVWVGIVLLRHRSPRDGSEAEQLATMQRRLDELENVGQRLAEVEERLDFAERLLTRQPETQQLPPSERGSERAPGRQSRNVNS
jgi:hypothetical protein